MEKTTRITTLDEHRKLLKTVFQTAKSRVLVVSPFIAESAIRHDRVPKLVSDAVHRGVNVDIFTDDRLNRQTDGSWKPAAKTGMASLVNAGAKVSIVNGIHNKTLARDEDLITEGSFNWLSAVRTKGADMQRHERTLVYEGEEVKGMVEKEVGEMENNSFGEIVKKTQTQPVLTPSKKKPTKNIVYILILGILLYAATGLDGILAAIVMFFGISILWKIATPSTKSNESDVPTDTTVYTVNNQDSDTSYTSQNYWFFWD